MATVASSRNGKPRRVAALLRVSTEKQEEKGESLAVQRQHAIEDIEERWHAKVIYYAGNEHATPGHERKIFDQLLKDAAHGKFDAVWVNEPSRWTRDNARSAEGLNILMQHKVRFFSRTLERNLFDPNDKGCLQMEAVIGEIQAGTRKIAAFDSREKRAARNIPTCGKLPHGRLYDKKTGVWSLDPEKHERIKEIARRVLKGEAVRNLAPEFGMSIGNLWKVLMNQCGDTWSFSFRRPGVDEPTEYTMKIPRLLPDSTIAKLRTKIRANRSLFHNGEPRHRYLLKGYIFCSYCGYSLHGTPNHGDKTVYRHSRVAHKRSCSCQHTSYLHAEVVEENVVRQLFEVRKNPRLLEAAMKAAIPKPDEVAEIREEQAKLSKLVKSSHAQMDRLVTAIANGTISDDDAKRSSDRIKKQREKYESRLLEIDNQLKNVPSDEQAKLVSARVTACVIRPPIFRR